MRNPERVLPMNAQVPADTTTDSFLSGDGTRIGYRQMGKGPGLVLLHDSTGSHNVFALSSGALVTLRCALMSPAVRKMALYEPPLDIGARPSPLDWVPRYETELAANLAAAMVAIIKGTGDQGLLTHLPGFVLRPTGREPCTRKADVRCVGFLSC
jgi:pimeloyl-ACP methyl ester carboxylesterase